MRNSTLSGFQVVFVSNTASFIPQHIVYVNPFGKEIFYFFYPVYCITFSNL
jgi:hypothetical protein